MKSSRDIAASLPSPTRPHVPEDRLFGFVEAVYDTLTDDDLWGGIAQRMNELVPVDWFTMSSVGPAFERAELQLSDGVDDAAIRAYDEHFASVNPWMAEPLRPFAETPGFAGAGHWVVPEGTLDRLEFGQDFLRPNGLFYAATSVLDVSPELSSNLGIFRSRAAGPYSNEEVATIRVVSPHIRQALRVRARLMVGEGLAASLEAVLDRVSIGAVLLGGDGRALQFNRRAREIFANDDGLTLDAKGRLVGARPDDTNRMTTAIHAAVANAEGRALRTPGAVAVSRPSGSRPHIVQVAPLRVDGSRTQTAGTPRAVVFVGDPDREAVPPEDQLQDVYGLTPAEARLAVQLAAGHSVSEAAEILRIRVGTARQHLKRVFAKTGARRQAELVRLLLASVVPIRQDA